MSGVSGRGLGRVRLALGAPVGCRRMGSHRSLSSLISPQRATLQRRLLCQQVCSRRFMRESGGSAATIRNPVSHLPKPWNPQNPQNPVSGNPHTPSHWSCSQGFSLALPPWPIFVACQALCWAHEACDLAGEVSVLLSGSSGPERLADCPKVTQYRTQPSWNSEPESLSHPQMEVGGLLGQ